MHAASPRLPAGSGGHADGEGPGNRRGQERPPAGGGGGGGGRCSSGGEGRGAAGRIRAWRDGNADVAAPRKFIRPVCFIKNFVALNTINFA